MWYLITISNNGKKPWLPTYLYMMGRLPYFSFTKIFNEKTSFYYYFTKLLALSPIKDKPYVLLTSPNLYFENTSYSCSLLFSTLNKRKKWICFALSWQFWIVLMNPMSHFSAMDWLKAAWILPDWEGLQWNRATSCPLLLSHMALIHIVIGRKDKERGMGSLFIPAKTELFLRLLLAREHWPSQGAKSKKLSDKLHPPPF